MRLKKYLSGQNADLDDDVLDISLLVDSMKSDPRLLRYFSSNIDSAICHSKKEIADKDSAIYGMLSKISKNVADFIEGEAKNKYKKIALKGFHIFIKKIIRDSYSQMDS